MPWTSYHRQSSSFSIIKSGNERCCRWFYSREALLSTHKIRQIIRWTSSFEGGRNNNNTVIFLQQPPNFFLRIHVSRSQKANNNETVSTTTTLLDTWLLVQYNRMITMMTTIVKKWGNWLKSTVLRYVRKAHSGDDDEWMNPTIRDESYNSWSFVLSNKCDYIYSFTS